MKDIQYFQAGFKAIPYEPKAEGSADIEGTRIEGYASTPTLDRYNDVVSPEAFRESIVKNYRNNPIVLFQHNPERPVGKATYMSIDMKGLFIKAVVYDREIEDKIQKGILRTFSIGYIPKEMEFQDENGNILDPAKDNIWAKGVKRIIKKVDLVENSIVSVPANPDALFTLEKSVKSFFAKMQKGSLTYNSLTQKDMEDNLLETKEEETTPANETEDTASESAENAETPAETPESVEEEVTETPADETSGKEEVDETSDEGETESAESEKVEEEPAEEVEEVQAEESPAEGASDEGEKAVRIDPKLCTPENMKTALENLVIAKKRIAELEAQLDKTPAKQSLIYHKKFNESDGSGNSPAKEKREEKRGFKSAFIANANY